MMSNVEVAEFVRKKIASNMKPPLVSVVLLFMPAWACGCCF